MKRKDIILALLVVIIWGANFTVIKLGLSGVPSMLLVTLRYVFTIIPAIFFIKKEKKESYEISCISDEIFLSRHLYYLCYIYLL